MFETFTSIVLVIVFLVPGYIWRHVEGRFTYLYHRLPWEKFSLELLTRSTFIYLPFAPWIYQAWLHNWYETRPLFTSVASIFFIAVLPATCGLLVGIAKSKNWLGRIARLPFVAWFLTKTHLHTPWYLPVPTAWEAVFNSKLEACYIIVTRKSGEQVRGVLDEESHISVDPEDRDIYISRVLYFDEAENEYKFVPGTKGVYIHADEISTIELIEYSPPETPTP